MALSKACFILPIYLSALMLLAACQQDVPSEVADEVSSKQTAGLELWPANISPFKDDPALEKRISDMLAQMSLEQKVGQMAQAEITWVTPEDVKKYHLGSVLHGGGSFLNGNRYTTVDEWLDYVEALYQASMDTSDGGLPIPITYGTDAVHGHGKIIGATLFPHNIGLGATDNPELIREIGKITATEVLVTGMDWTFSPALSVVRDDRWGRAYEGYSEDPEIVARFAGEMVIGLQGQVGAEDFLGDQYITANAKHYVGDGGTVDGVDRGDTISSEEELINIHSAGYFPAIKAGVQTIMASHSSWQGIRMHGHKYLLTDVLKERMGFDGFIVGDWNSHALIEGCTNDNCPEAVNAGLDMFMVVEDWKAFIENTVEQVKTGIIPESRIDDAVRRILRVKIRSGLFEKGAPKQRPFANRQELLGASEHRTVARQAVRESLVLLKNKNQILPLKPNQTVLVTGDGADNIGKQTGGWSINWTGEGNPNKDFPGATSIYAGIKTAVEAAGGKVLLSEDGSYSEKPDVAVVVYGENPYAEWLGDVETIAYQRHSKRDAKLLESLKQQEIPVVSVFISGRPRWVNREINASDAFVAAWLPGTEGAGVADVLIANTDGTANHDFTGKLTFSWPKHASHAALNRGDADYDPLFPYGFGLRYGEQHALSDTLDTELDVQFDAADANGYDIFTGRIGSPWFAALLDANGIEYLSAPTGKNTSVRVRDADKDTQGDAREITWLGNAWGAMAIASPWERVELSRYVGSQSVLSVDIRVEQAPAGALNIGMICGESVCGSADISKQLQQYEPGAWQSLSVDLLCLAQTGTDFERVAGLIAFSSESEASLRFANARLVVGGAASADISCQTK